MATLFMAFCMIIFGIMLVYLKLKRKRRIPSPNVIPLIGGIFEFLRVFGPTAHRTLMSRFNELGPIYQFGFLKNKMTFLFTLKDLLKLKQIEGLNPVHIDFKHLRLYRTQHDLPLGLLVSSGDEWQRQRKYIGKALLSSAVLKGYLNAVDEVAVQTVQDMTPIILCDKTVDMEDIIGTYVLKAMARVIMGYKGESQEEETVKDFTAIIETARENFKDAKTLLSTPSFLWPLIKAWPRHSGRWDKLLKTTKRYIDKYLFINPTQFDEEPCVMAQLLKSPGLSLQEAHINITDLILASIDTTSSSILWCVYELSRSTAVQNTLFLEIQDYLEKHDVLSFVGLQDLSYLRAVLRESQRLHPVGFFVSRIIQEPTTVQGHHIGEGSHVAGSMYVIGRDKDLFRNPDMFNPDRWLDENHDLETFINNVPFGLGRRMCIGRRVADLVISSFIFNLTKSFTIKAVNDKPIEPTFRLIMVPSEPVLINLQSR